MLKNKQGNTLVEVMIGVFLFLLLANIGLLIFSNGVRAKTATTNNLKLVTDRLVVEHIIRNDLQSIGYDGPLSALKNKGKKLLKDVKATPSLLPLKVFDKYHQNLIKKNSSILVFKLANKDIVYYLGKNTLKQNDAKYSLYRAECPGRTEAIIDNIEKFEIIEHSSNVQRYINIKIKDTSGDFYNITEILYNG